MSRRKGLCTIVTASLTISLIAGCGASAPSPVETSKSGTSEKQALIKVFVASPEYTDAYNAAILEYKKVKPNVTIQLEIMQSDYPTVLKTKIATGDMPDVFQSTAGEIKQYAEYSADLSNEPLAQAMTDSVKTSMSNEGKVLGLPINVAMFSLIYNKDLFADAGISDVPKTSSQLTEAITKLKAKGITPFANGYKEWWVHKHILQQFINAESDNAMQLMSDFNTGKTTFKDHPTLMKMFDFVDTTIQNGMPKPLERDFPAEISDFATGKAAIITAQGAWAESGISKINPNLQIGIMGYPINEDPNKSMIVTGADQALRINKNSKSLQETKDFFNWLYTSEYGKSWFGNIAKVIPPIKNGDMPNMQMAKALTEYLKAGGKAGALSLNYSIDSFYQKYGEDMQAYIGKAKTKEQVIEQIQKDWIQLGAPK
ncbi:hypothetical protein GCM10008018_16730 [Paenibacillus marchantiophytorum]|uniref:Extracellular solute-binding protein n=1 Tax=Paenibacillus marchantiophytorum TaxID=1619310 RepID=A0ABQ2BS96_9BACL|nr:extracellular solute-binding protein [Paenibacillus marchantiophytorum]GGI46365.1 hypothetical protein GCM10008018_16730 [Paenibacillus marchantiophytorum]